MLKPRHIEEIMDWCSSSPDLDEARQAGRQVFYGDEDWRSIEYMDGADTEVSRTRRFIAWFMFAYLLPDGRVPAQVAAEALYRGRFLEEVRLSIKRSRYVTSVVAGVEPGRSVFLALEDERFEVRSREFSRLFERGITLVAWLLPNRRGKWLFGPGWLEMPFSVGPNMRQSLSDFQMDPIETDRLLRKPTEEEMSAARETAGPRDENLDDAVARMTEAAREEGSERLVMSREEWKDLVLQYLLRNDSAGFPQAIMERVDDAKNLEDVNRWLALAMNIWNNTPQPDRGGKTALELIAGGPLDREDAGSGTQIG
ncbi:MAG: hypothetical protein J4N96_04485 [Chloroflexi bacterium]|nr:hypothetical protein [Chloroflexota bacterium]